MRHDEDREQAAVFAVLDSLVDEYPACGLVFHPPNGGARDARAGAMMKRAGTRRGVPDIICPILPAWNDYASPPGPLAIEMKAPGGRLAFEQRQFLAGLQGAGWRTEVCYSAGEAVKVLADHMRIPVSPVVLRNKVVAAGGSWPE